MLKIPTSMPLLQVPFPIAWMERSALIASYLLQVVDWLLTAKREDAPPAFATDRELKQRMGRGSLEKIAGNDKAYLA